MRPPPGHVHVQEDKLLFAASQYNASSSSWSLTWWGSKYNIGLGPQNNRERETGHIHMDYNWWLSYRPKWQRHYNPINISDNRPQETLPEQILPTETGHRYPQEWLVRNSAPKLLCYTIHGQINIQHSAIGLSLTPKLWLWLHTTTLWSIIVILGNFPLLLTLGLLNLQIRSMGIGNFI